MAATASPLLLGSLSIPRTRFFGREEEIAAACALLVDDAVPLLTLTGPGGVGKTRLGLATANAVIAHFADGIAWVDLAPLGDPTLVPGAVAAALAVPLTANQPTPDELVCLIRSRQMLLFLDNCEHMLEETAALVAALLAGCPALQVLATSRASLRVRGEQLLPVAPLSLPAVDAPLATIAEAEAVRLFAARARAVCPGFQVETANAGPLALLCRQLDGLPLAIELAAAHSAVIAPAAMLTQMIDRLRLLVGGARDLPPRQQTMREAIAWSYDRLAAAEQAAFRAVSVFAGGWTAPSAAAVLDLDEHETLGLLERLADYSLVVTRVGADGDTPRFAMLETVRAFGLERLAEAGEADQIRRAHADWCLLLGEQVDRAYRDRQEFAMLLGIDPERDNLRAALTWLAAAGDAEGLLRLAGSTAPFWFARSYRREGREWVGRALSLADGRPVPADAHVRALTWASMMARNEGDYAQAMARASEALALARETGNDRGTFFALEVLGYTCLSRGEYDPAAAYFQSSLEVAEASGSARDIPAILVDAGMAAFGAGNLAAATRKLEAGLAAVRSADTRDIWTEGQALNGLGLVACAHGDRADAATWYGEALQFWQANGNRENLAECLAGIATFAATFGAAARSAWLYGAADRVRAELGHAFVMPGKRRFDRAEQDVRSAIGDLTFPAAWDAGRVASLDDTLQEAAAVLAGRSGPASTSASAVPQPEQATPPMLTRREQEVLSLLCQRQTDQEIADALFISPYTVSKHVSNVLGKLGVANRRQAAAFAVRHALV